MPQRPSSREMGYYLALAQVGLEFVVPTVLGLLLDHWLGTSPWLTVGLTVLGFVGGLFHLVTLLRKFEEEQPPPDDKP